MLLTELRKYVGIDALGKKLGKLTCVAINTKTWAVEAVVLKKLFAKPEEYKLEKVKSLDEAKHKITLEGKGAPLPEPVLEHICCHELMKKKLLSSDEKDAGRIYDIVLATQFLPWKIDKLLIHIKPLERRVRLSTGEVKSISENIQLAKSYDQLRGLKE